jgi:plastocyanin
MKFIYILLAIILFVGFVDWYLLNAKNREVPAQLEQVQEKQIETVKETIPTTQEPTTTAEKKVIIDENSSASDVGMEFPETDVSNVNQSTKVFEVSAENFAFSLKEIKVNVGDTVVITFTSTDGTHDWVLDAFNAHTDRVGTGKTSQVTFIAQKKGIYEYYCSVGSHRAMGMVGKLVVE